MTPEFGFCFRPVHGRGDCSGRLHLWVRYRNATRVIPTLYDVRHDEWNPVEGRLLVSECADHRRPLLCRYSESMAKDLVNMATLIAELENSSVCGGHAPCSIHDIIRHWNLRFGYTKDDTNEMYEEYEMMQV